MTFLNEKEAAEVLTVKPATLAYWRMKRKGPAFYKYEGSIRYNKDDLTDFIKKNRIVTEETVHA